MVRVKKMKVVFIHPDLGIGGAERLVLDVALALKKQGIDVSFITNHFDPNHCFLELKNSTFPVKVYGDWLPRSFFGLFQALCAYIRMLYLAFIYTFFCFEENKPNIYFVDQIPMAVPILKYAKYKVIYYCHHPDLLASAPGGILKNFYRYPLNVIEEKGTNMADIILVNSNYTARIFTKTFPSIKKRIYVLYPSVPPTYNDLVQKETSANPPKIITDILKGLRRERVCIFLSINRFHPAKNLMLAIQAMRTLKLKTNRWDDTFLILAGGCDPESKINNRYFNELDEYVKTKNLTGKVIFLKSPSDTEKVKLILNCDCLVYTPAKEHFGIVPLEAMMAQKPVIAIDDGGPRETVKHSLTGYLCKPNPTAMAECMKMIVEDRNNAVKMGLNGKKHCEETFSYETFSKNIMKIVEALVLSNVTNLNTPSVYVKNKEF